MKQIFNHLLTPAIITLSFLGMYLLGSLLLALPISQLATSEADYFDHLFNAVSAVSVTGLYIESIHDSYTLFGKIIMLLLIQIGGLGIMTIYGYVMGLFHHQMDYRQKQAMVTAVSFASIGKSLNFIKKIVTYTLIIEGLGALLLSFAFVPELGWQEGLFTSVFASVSAFCNAGFFPLGNANLMPYFDNILINLVITTLIILGGIGYVVWFDITDKWRQKGAELTNKHYFITNLWSRLRVHTKLALLMSAVLIIGGTILFLLLEGQNEDTLGNLPLWQKVMVAYFQSVTVRTSGFATIDFTLAKPLSLQILIYLMMIGGSPGGTAGGMKTTTIAIILIFYGQYIKGKKYTTVDHRSIATETINKAFLIFALYILWFALGTALIQLFNSETPIHYIMFEVASALGTVGVSANLTPLLSMPSQIVIMLLMFVGRTGPLTLLASLELIQRHNETKDIIYAKTDILVG